MLFNSLAFALFLPVVFLLYWFVCIRNLRMQNLLVVTASYFFYGCWDWRFLFLIAFTSLCSWGSGLLIQRYADHHKKAKAISAGNILLNLAILALFKYYNFFVSSFANVFLHGNTHGLLLNIILPVGISFYTFQALSYSIDVYKKRITPTRDLVQFLAYVSFFPQLVAGPIERATHLLPQFAEPRTFSFEQGRDGLRQFLWGLFKKVAVADSCARLVDPVFNNYQDQSGATLAIAAILFAFQIYGDFSGYSDMAIGTAKLFGIRLMRNFNNPYFSRDIAEFWRRWHISLTTWFRDYIYIPLGGSRCSKWKVVRNTLVIFLVSGLWHGANWTFIAWGLYHALLFLPLILLDKNKKHTGIVAEERLFPSWKECLSILSTFMLVVIGWVIFRADNLPHALHYLQHLTTPGAPNIKGLVPVSIYVLIMLGMEWIMRKKEHGLDLKSKHHVFNYILYIFLIVILFLSYAGSESFIYFQF